jgi:site-specific recombinase XerD
VQDWLGHANIQNTVIYSHLVSSSRTEKARKHFLKLPRF